MNSPGSAEKIFKDGTVFNPYTCEWIREDIAIRDGHILGTGPGYHAPDEIDLNGAYVVPGFIDAHVHIESSLLTPYEYCRLVMQHGTTTVIADPHEIANVCGTSGIEYMLRANRNLPLDILLMLPSCVPATPLDECAMELSADILRPFIGEKDIIGLGEMMNVPGVLSRDPRVMEKLALSEIRDGHAPSVTGIDLDRYISSGLQSDHESISFDEGREKLRKGMYLFIREGSTERNLRAHIPLVSPYSSSRCCFCTDDRHVDMLVQSGHIDDCIRKAITEGCEPEIAFRMATLSASERFGLSDRGALSPGKLADFSIVTDTRSCTVSSTYKAGNLVSNESFGSPDKISPIPYLFRARIPTPGELKIQGDGMARVIRIREGQIGTGAEYHEISGQDLPDLKRDILKVVVLSRYNPDHCGVGLVSGFGLEKGAIASSVSHDSHNIIATGTSDSEIISALSAVLRHRGAMVINSGKRQECLPLSLAGLMSELPYEEVNEILSGMEHLAEECGSIADPFMYLSFLALTVIPELRVTERGVFDYTRFSTVPLYLEDN